MQYKNRTFTSGLTAISLFSTINRKSVFISRSCTCTQMSLYHCKGEQASIMTYLVYKNVRNSFETCIVLQSTKKHAYGVR